LRFCDIIANIFKTEQDIVNQTMTLEQRLILHLHT